MSNLKVFLKNFIPDSVFLKIKYKKLFKKALDLKNPQTFNEKLQWLKLHDRKPEYTDMVDKYAVKKYVADKIGTQYIIPTLGVWDSFDEIDFDKLPNQFVLKCTHDSGGVIICKDKKTFSVQKAKEKINNNMKQNFYYLGREWPYKNVKPRIIAEKYMSDNDYVPIDYKIYCFNGKPYKIMLCLDRDKEDATKFYSFDFQWNLLRHNGWGKKAPEDFTLPKPINLDKMYEFSAELSKNIAFLRVDFYEVNEQLYFGELTFYPDSGFDSAILPEIDLLYGNMINLN
jgi:hypothetical protein